MMASPILGFSGKAQPIPLTQPPIAQLPTEPSLLGQLQATPTAQGHGSFKQG
jgi:hypothetical protein